MSAVPQLPSVRPQKQEVVRLFLCGDVMTGRGVDQILPYPCNPLLHEFQVHSAADYVRIAEEANGAIPRPAAPSYPWGAALEEFERSRPDVRIINLETSITRSEDYVPKGINYRMSPENADCLAAAGIDCCTLANNHVLDWGPKGLLDTLATLNRLHIKTAGAGRNIEDARAPAFLDVPGKGRVLVFSFASVTSGTPRDWAATRADVGINLLTGFSKESAARVSDQVMRLRKPDDVVVVSIHWGSNWGHSIPDDQQHFARTIIEMADVSIVHGHSSHHPKAMEVYRSRLILYGCGDFLNDYEGIGGYEDYRDDLALMYFVDINLKKNVLAALEIVPLQIRQFRLGRPPDRDLDWLQHVLNRESGRFGTTLLLSKGRLRVESSASPE
jgi:poly-gamma-glutamate synthesis protein (capsule biosynthesis protein)